MYVGCLAFRDTVYMQTEEVSHTNATSTVRVEINPNSTGGIEEFYYAFCVSYNESQDYQLVACATGSGELLEIQHSWEGNGLAVMRVGVFTETSRNDPIGCNETEVIVAGGA